MPAKDPSINPRSTLKWVRELSGTGAAGIADLAGYRDDLRRVRSACERLLALASAEERDDELIEMIWTYAVINYARHYAKGMRQQLPEDFLDSLSAGARGTHDRILSIRNKYFAHSVNSMETNIPIYELSDPAGATRQVLRVGTLLMRRSWDIASESLLLLHLTREVSRALELLTQRFHQHVLNQLEDKAIDDLYAEASILETRIEREGSATTPRPSAKNRDRLEPIRLA